VQGQVRGRRATCAFAVFIGTLQGPAIPASPVDCFFGTAAGVGAVLGAGRPEQVESEDDGEQAETFRPNPIPLGFGPFAPFAIFIHHLPVTPGLPLANINDPANITDFRGFVGITRIRGGGIGTDTVTGVPADLAFQIDMGFNQGHFIGTDGRLHEGTFAFV